MSSILGSTSSVPGEYAGGAAGRLASVLEASSDAIYNEDRAGTILTWNQGAERLYGYGASEVLGRRSDMLFPVPLRGDARGLLERVLVGERLEQVETEVQRQDGMVVPVWLSLSPVWEASVISGATAVARDVTEQKQALATLAESEAQLQEAQALAHVGIWVWDSVAGTVQWSDELYRIHEVSPMDFDGTVESYLALVRPEDRDRVGQETRDAVESGRMLETEYEIVRPSGQRRWVHLRAEPVVAALTTVGLRGICQDMTERKQAEEALRRHAETLSLLQQIAVAANEAQTLEEALRACLRAICRHGEWPVGRAQFISAGGDQLENEVWFPPTGPTLVGRDAVGIGPEAAVSGEPVWASHATGTTFSCPVLVGTQVVAVLEFFSDDERPPDEQLIEATSVGRLQLGPVLDRVRAEEALSHQALHDPLTNQPNRTLFLDRLGHALASLGREHGLIAVLFLDLDGFKMINDSLGHLAGDELLRAVADRLNTTLRPSDTVARFGGDEFTILCEELGNEQEALSIARRVADIVAEPLALEGGHEVALTASVGIAFSRGAGTPESLLRDADVAMYRAKEQGPARCEIFDVALHARATARLDTVRALRHAVELDQLRLHYQPQVTLPEGRIIGVEALVRWQHPERGLLGPMEFIPLAEESQLVLSIGEWVIQEACRQAVRWRDELATPAKVSVNVSARQLGDGDLADCIREVLKATGMEAEALCLEITENVLMGDADFYLEALLGLRFLGVSLAVDDFGTGYSSLGYLNRFPINVLKVDKAFVDGLGVQDQRARAIPRAVVAMARDLGMITVAEGVETLEQAQDLTALGCHQAQGYYFSRPQPPDAMSELFRRGTLP